MVYFSPGQSLFPPIPSLPLPSVCILLSASHTLWLVFALPMTLRYQLLTHFFLSISFTFITDGYMMFCSQKRSFGDAMRPDWPTQSHAQIANTFAENR